ncbi:MAG: 50S ribosomal protein L18 [Elusimicrobia bacterium]|nr:50S ribosomal protein L18 [Elusimicrobiota bacterium]
MKDKWIRYEYRKERTRRILQESVGDRPRLSVHRSLRYIYAQVIDDRSGKTVASATSLSKEFKGLKSRKNLEAAKRVGELVAKKAREAGVSRVAFDRGARVYHGRIRAVAEGARAGGLEF